MKIYSNEMIVNLVNVNINEEEWFKKLFNELNEVESDIFSEMEDEGSIVKEEVEFDIEMSFEEYVKSLKEILNEVY